jgi:hypothetical protein
MIQYLPFRVLQKAQIELKSKKYFFSSILTIAQNKLFFVQHRILHASVILSDCVTGGLYRVPLLSRDQFLVLLRIKM